MIDDPDEFIKEREKYAIIGDDLDLAFVGQKMRCTFNRVIRFCYSKLRFPILTPFDM